MVCQKEPFTETCPQQHWQSQWHTSTVPPSRDTFVSPIGDSRSRQVPEAHILKRVEAAMTPEHQHGRGRLLQAILVLVMLLGMAYFILPVINSSKDRVVEDYRTARLKHIAAATRIYRERNGTTPKTLRDLDGIKLQFPKGGEFTFGTESLVKDGVVPYQYFPEVSGTTNARLVRTVPLAYATTADKAGQYYCVYADGTVETLEWEEIQQRIALLHNSFK
jgi:hypothetical protein